MSLLTSYRPDGNGATYLANNDISPMIDDMLVFQMTKLKVDGVYKIKDSTTMVESYHHLGEYESEVGKVVDPSIVMETEYNGVLNTYFAP